MARYGEGPRISLALWARPLVASTVAARLADKAAPAAKKKIRFMARPSRDDDAGRPNSNQVEDDVEVAARRLRARTGLLDHGSLPFAFMRLLVPPAIDQISATSTTASAKACGASWGRLCPMPPVMVRCAYLPENFLA